MLRSLLFFSIFMHCTCFAERYIVPAKYEDQEEIFFQGGIVTVSKKINSLSMYQTCENIINRKANFFFNFSNQTDRPINLMFSNLRVTDQSGRPLKVLRKSKLIDEKRSDKNWADFLSSSTECSDIAKARDAGKVNFQAATTNNTHSHFHTHKSDGWASGHSHIGSTSITQGQAYSEGLTQQAIRQAQQEAAARNFNNAQVYALWEHGLNNFYFDSTTVFPETTYGGNIQIEIPKKLEKELEFVIFTFDVGDEEHSFCFYCPEATKKRR